jgi:putative hemolysin
MESVTTELTIIAALLVLNAAFSMSEMAIVSSKKARLSQWAEEGHSSARRALELANDPGRLLSTVQIGITLVSVLSGLFSGASTATLLGNWIGETFPPLANSARLVGVGIMVSLITFLSIVLGELLPKRIALHSPEKIASFLAPPMHLVARASAPLVYLLNSVTETLLRLVGRHGPNDDPPVTEEEIKSLVQQGTDAGVFDTTERDMMERVLSFSDKNIHSMMTPRPDVVWLNIGDSFEKNRAKMSKAPHSHFPVVRESLDSVLGTVHVKDVLSHDISKSEDLTKILTPPLFIPESSGALHVVETFKRTGVHIAFIIDEYGSVQGLVTITDLLEAIVGDLPTDSSSGPGIVRREDGSYLMDGVLPIDEFKSQFQFDTLPEEERAAFKTLAGFVLSYLGRIPRTADHFVWNGLHFEVVDMDGNRIDKILVSRTKHD